jgi:hypothetical protein
LVVVVALVVGALYWVQDANRLKPDIEALIADQTQVEVRINGDIAWELWPPLTLVVSDVEARQPDRTVTVGTLELEVDLSAIWQDVNAWRVTSLELTDLALTGQGATTSISRFALSDFRPRQAAPFAVDLVHSPEQGAPTSVAANGLLTYEPASGDAPQRLSFTETDIVTDLAEGTCSGDLTERMDVPANLPASGPDDLLPVALLLSYNAVVDCKLSALSVGAETFKEGTLALTNVAGQSNVHVEIADFIGGSMIVDADIDATADPVAWTILPEMQDVDSQRLVDLSNQSLLWAAPLALTSSVSLEGNTQAELLDSLRAESEFDGGQGLLDVSKIKQQLSRLALLTDRSEKVAGWPDVLNYDAMVGQLTIDGKQHDLDFSLDNLSIDAIGDIDYLADSVDLLAHVTVHEPPEGGSIDINPLLIDTPIPMRCRGTPAEPKCRLDNDAAKDIVAQALQRGSTSGLREKLEEKIEEEVPEEYKETAKDILDLIGRALKGD